MTRTQQQEMADQMIGAAQRLERAAKELKVQAKLVRQGSLHASITRDTWTMHKAADIKRTAEDALAELTGQPVALQEAAAL